MSKQVVGIRCLYCLRQFADERAIVAHVKRGHPQHAPPVQKKGSLRKVEGDARWNDIVQIDSEWAVSFPFEIGIYVTGFKSEADAKLIAEMLEREREGTVSLCSED